ncbi:hypothetical protein [Maridesulfovibrio ferrireducens]|uniref:hypothetical protein n=1 Tax=Maridesulfovibrio ferrireducens TaxID=246191 RepID=UPI001A1C69EA|nr:hypothetical protein [Maridesulfovibrio ferrireducens]MBI9109916.1 hypothetical protein [Maridesulfovibrio ferrireducens]
MIKVETLSLEDKKKLAADLLPFFVQQLHANPEMILPGTEKSVKVQVRIVDSGKISTGTHDELAAAEAALDDATTIAGLKAAVKTVIGIFRVILMGRK